MVNHPNRSQKSVDAAVRRLLTKYPLETIEVVFRSKAVTARAIPLSFHPLVSERRQAAFAAHGGSMSLNEATAYQERAMGAVAAARAETLEEAISALAAELAKTA